MLKYCEVKSIPRNRKEGDVTLIPNGGGRRKKINDHTERQISWAIRNGQSLLQSHVVQSQRHGM